jgi:hydroxyacylglutathione hydrolase
MLPCRPLIRGARPVPPADAAVHRIGPGSLRRSNGNMAERLDVEVFTDRNFGQNAYLVRRVGGSRAVAVDPGGGAPDITGVAAVVRATGAPVYLHAADLGLYRQATAQAAMFGFRVEALPPPDQELKAGETIRVADCEFQVRHVPGHSPGHVLLYVEDAGVAFVGDVIFMGSIGRTDLPGGDYQQLMRSIREQVLTLPDATVLFSGHGPETTVGHERVANPFLAPSYGGGLA